MEKKKKKKKKKKRKRKERKMMKKEMNTKKKKCNIKNLESIKKKVSQMTFILDLISAVSKHLPIMAPP